MIPPNHDRLYVPIFAGQGSPLPLLSAYVDCAIRDTQRGLCSTLLTICHEAFRSELSSLSLLELAHTGVNLEDFRSPETILTMWTSRFFQNPILSSSALVLIQLLRYLSFVEHLSTDNWSLNPFNDILQGHLSSQVGVLGFSFGILPACVVSASHSISSYLSFAVEAYRLSLWIGIRCRLNRLDALGGDTARPWSVVFLGISLEAAQEAISKFRGGDTSKVENPSDLYITAVMDGSCVTISGHPNVLAEFRAKVIRSFGPSVVACDTTVDTLYHSVDLDGVRDNVLSDVVRHNIKFPNLSDLRAPIRSTSTGLLLDRLVPLNQSLVQLVVNMLLVEPVRWDLVTSRVSESLLDEDIVLLNIGPGVSLSRNLEKLCTKGRVQIRDLCSDFHHARPKQEPIAIVGMAVNMPGSPNVSKLWENIEKGINTLSEIPHHRFNIEEYDGAKNNTRRMKAHTGNFLEGVDEFDNQFFRISPREAKSMDPQQRLLLHAAYEALEDSGYVAGTTPTSHPDMVGCYIGVATHDYLQNLRDHIDVYYSTGTLKSFLSGRISYAMGFSGPSIVIDTACSSSLVAVYQGVRALANGDCNLALVGGVNVISSPDMFLGLDRGHFLSPTGQCKPFDASADGYSRSEGCGMFVLKRFSDAIAESDNIYGVIRGIEVNHSGLAQSITHPHSPTQVALFNRVLRNAGVPPSRVNVVEAHGTGTQAGDVNEVASIRSVFSTGRSVQDPLHITSIKGNLGHLEAASGAAGLAKLLLMFKYRTIPPQISFLRLNPLIASLESDNTSIDRTSVAWRPSHEGNRRVAFLNNFGAAGSNAALVLEEHVQNPSQAFAHPLLFTLSAKDAQAVDKLRSKCIAWLESPSSEDIPFTDISYSMTARRQSYSHRLAVVASDRADLVEGLRKAVVKAPSHSPAPKVIFVFSGQGGQYLGMGHTLYNTSPHFKRSIDECHEILVSMGFPGILPIITASTSTLTRMEEHEAYQAAIVSLEYALAELWMFWGLSPVAIVGHSLGEYTALVIAGVLSLRGALTLVAHRVRFLLRKCKLDSTGMLAINLSADIVKDLLASSDNFCSIAVSCFNGPKDCVVSGSLTILHEFKAFLDATMDCRSKMLAVPYGYHSDTMSPILDDLIFVAQKAELRTPRIPIASNVHGRVVFPGEAVFSAEYFAQHCSLPVRFDDGIRDLVAAFRLSANDIWLEIGPHPTCLPMLKPNSTLSPKSALLPSLRKHQDVWATLGHTLCSLFLLDVPLHWRNVFAHLPGTKCTSLPSYPFMTTKYWVTYEEDRLPKSKSADISQFTLLARWTQYPCSENGLVAMFETPIVRLSGLIHGHSVGELPLCPASVFVEIVLASVELSSRFQNISTHDSLVRISSIDFVKGLVYKENVSRTLVIKISLDGNHGSFSISSRVDLSAELVLHAEGEYRLQQILHCTTKFSESFSSVARRISHLKDPNTRAEIFLTRTTYEVIFPRVVRYAKEYQALQSVLVTPDELEGFASVHLPSNCYQGSFVAHPVLIDTVLQLPGFIANMQGSIGDAFICTAIKSIKVITDMLDETATYSLYCKGLWLDDQKVSLSFEVFAIKDGDSPQLISHLNGVTFRRMSLQTLQRGLAIAAVCGNPQPPRSLLVPITTPLVHSRARSHSSPPNFTNVVGELHSQIYQAIADTCNMDRKHVTADSELDALGIDSLMFIELSAKLAPKIDLQLGSLYSCKTVADILKISSVALGLGESSCSVLSETSSTTTLVADDKFTDSVLPYVSGNFDVRRLISSILDISSEAIHDDIELELLGLDSLASIEVLEALKKQFGDHLGDDFLVKHRTVACIQRYLDIPSIDVARAEPSNNGALQSPPKEATRARIIRDLRLGTNPVLIQKHSGGNSPIFFIHDGSGLINYYSKIGCLHRPVWAIYNPNFALGRSWDSITTMAVAYADYICSLTDKPVLLGGWSFGGVVAYEVALQLVKRGLNIKGIVLVDAPNPVEHVPLSDTIIRTISKFNHKTGPIDIGRLVRSQFAMGAQLLSTYDPHATGGICPPLVVLRSRQGYVAEGLEDIPKWLADRSDPKTAIAGWAQLTNFPIKVWDIPGDHFQVFSITNIQSISSKLLDACTYIETL